MSSSYPRGSEWRRWDLHVHTPYSIVQNYGNKEDKGTWERFISDLEKVSPKISVYGINDYLFLKGYNRLINEQRNNNRLPNITLLPVIELRLDKFSGIDFNNWNRINFHIIFSNEIPPDLIESNFIYALNQSYKLDSEGLEWRRNITEENLSELGRKIKQSVPEEKLKNYGSDIKEGFNNINFSEKDIYQALNKDCFKGKYLTAIGKSEWSSLKWTDSSIATKKDIINSVDFVFTAVDNREQWINSKNTLMEQKVNDNLLDCSDAHNFNNSKEKDRIGNSLTWIKADPTFNGLRQLCNEFSGRLYIGLQPDEVTRIYEHGQHIIDSIEITPVAESNNSWFDNVKISFNSQLCSIIGNKGMGKSALAEIISLVGNANEDRYMNYSFLNHNKFLKGALGRKFKANITWKNGTKNESVLESRPDNNKKNEVIFIPQDYFEQLCTDVTNNEIMKSELDRVLMDYLEIYDKYNEKTIEGIKDKLSKIERDVIEYLKDKIKLKIKTMCNLLNINSDDHRISLQDEIDDLGIIYNDKLNDLELIEKNLEKINTTNGDENDKQSTIDDLEIDLNKLNSDIEMTSKNLESINENLLLMDQLRVNINKITTLVMETNEKFRDITNEDKLITLSINDSLLKNADKTFNKNKQECLNSLSNNSEVNKAIVLTTKKINDIRDKMNNEEKRLESLKNTSKIRKDELDNLSRRISEKIIEEAEIKSGLIYENILQLKQESLDLSQKIFIKKMEIRCKYYELYKKLRSGLDNVDRNENYNRLIDISSGFVVRSEFLEHFLEYIDQRRKGDFQGKDNQAQNVLYEVFSSINEESFDFLEAINKTIDLVIDNKWTKEKFKEQLVATRTIEEFLCFLFNIEYIEPDLHLSYQSKTLNQLSPGERALILFTFYTKLDKSDLPLIIDQPEENLDNQSIFEYLVPLLKEAKKCRQIILVTHNPNIAVVADSEQIIRTSIDKKNNNLFSFISGSLENIEITNSILTVLEGTKPAFRNRGNKYKIPLF